MYLIATIGPRSCDNKSIDAIIKGGADTIRINLSHGRYDEIDKVIGYIRLNYHKVKILMDLQGHKVRVSHKLNSEFFADKNSEIYFCSEENYDIFKKSVAKNLVPLNLDSKRIKQFSDKKIFMKDGTMKFNVLANEDGLIKTKTISKGMIRAEKGCNLPGIKRDGLTITEKDKKDIQFALDEKVDILCYSYCSSNDDCNNFKNQVFETLRRGDKIPRLFAKVETKDGVKNINEIADALDGVVIARGDLVPESDIFALPIIQDKIVNCLRKRNKDVIIATHVLNSMKRNGAGPSLHELADIYNMIRKNVSGFMLTSETTIGTNQYEIVRSLKQITDYYIKVNEKIKKKN
ncbi:MAG: pyruvate kinase [Sarcina sp.]